MYYVKFLERHNDHPIPLASAEENNHNQTKELTSINQIKESAADSPFITDDNNDYTTTALINPPEAPLPNAAIEDPEPQHNEPAGPCRSGHIQMPTEKADAKRIVKGDSKTEESSTPGRPHHICRHALPIALGCSSARELVTHQILWNFVPNSLVHILCGKQKPRQ